MVAVGAEGLAWDPAFGDLPGQWRAQLGKPHAVFEADACIRRLVRFGNTLGILSAVAQQIQSDRALLVDLGTQVGRSVVELLEGDLPRSSAHDVVWRTPDREALAWRIPGTRSPNQEGNEALRSPFGPIKSVAKV